MEITITSLAERPELGAELKSLQHSWPMFMDHDLLGRSLMPLVTEVFPEYVHVGTDDTGRLVARSLSVPFALHGERRGALPGQGWDQVLLWAFRDHRAGVRPDTSARWRSPSTCSSRAKGCPR
jgi:hypothetical protein